MESRETTKTVLPPNAASIERFLKDFLTNINIPNLSVELQQEFRAAVLNKTTTFTLNDNTITGLFNKNEFYAEIAASLLNESLKTKNLITINKNNNKQIEFSLDTYNKLAATQNSGLEFKRTEPKKPSPIDTKFSSSPAKKVGTHVVTAKQSPAEATTKQSVKATTKPSVAKNKSSVFGKAQTSPGNSSSKSSQQTGMTQEIARLAWEAHHPRKP